MNHSISEGLRTVVEAYVRDYNALGQRELFDRETVIQDMWIKETGDEDSDRRLILESLVNEKSGQDYTYRQRLFGRQDVPFSDHLAALVDAAKVPLASTIRIARLVLERSDHTGNLPTYELQELVKLADSLGGGRGGKTYWSARLHNISRHNVGLGPWIEKPESSKYGSSLAAARKVHGDEAVKAYLAEKYLDKTSPPATPPTTTSPARPPEIPSESEAPDPAPEVQDVPVPRHRLISLDESAKTGVCVICGPVTARRGGSGRWRCGPGQDMARGRRAKPAISPMAPGEELTVHVNGSGTQDSHRHREASSSFLNSEDARRLVKQAREAWFAYVELGLAVVPEVHQAGLAYLKSDFETMRSVLSAAVSRYSKQKRLDTRQDVRDAAEVFNLDPRAFGVKELKAKLREFAMMHPDLRPDDPEADEKMKDVNLAYGILRKHLQERQQKEGRA